MYKFKVGDKVVRTKACGKDEHFLSNLGQKIYYTVTSVIGDYWLQVDGWVDREDKHPWYTLNFELYQEPEDKELPPVPASVAYMNYKRDPGNDQRLVIDKDNGDGEGLMYIGVIPRKGSTRVKFEIGINIDPDSALQLAHDLRRMAMEIKRKEKAQ
ncbi:hypothetical protein [Klebsiella phage vB_KpnP_IME337]|uniref:Uncharacterized protein n=1 Tax=Klebsiella phage vB_KpnP_IME337 TaxID=2601650 RepID=A0A5J6CUL9_9CAUD|nr:hypothetical protein [Klebsiella phage vB_KpnP_IME337]